MTLVESRSAEGYGVDRQRRFLAMLSQTPVPSAPAPHDRYRQALGLNLLSVALRLDHVDRMSEELSLTDADAEVSP